jgi:hypothetical protein
VLLVMSKAEMLEQLTPEWRSLVEAQFESVAAEYGVPLVRVSTFRFVHPPPHTAPHSIRTTPRQRCLLCDL